MSPISPIRAVPLPEIRTSSDTRGAGGDFQAVLGSAIGSVEHLRDGAARTVQRFLSGEGEEVHTVALAAQRAEMAFETFLQVRNKVVSAYQAIMQMQV